MHLPLPLLLRFLRLSVCLSILYCLLALLVCVIFSAFKFTMATSGCGKPGCPCGSDCQCNSGCSSSLTDERLDWGSGLGGDGAAGLW
uniref:Uncharacterized protein n=1 Tax=Physcomitrium patens TaxID=3218 RepID=A0A7I4CZ48_PHYPA|nr:uncharacterized protein LOC112277384 isoform X2 [Physcomitrium patens]|eukprot:XP_024365379.1 uncharacterized protein LOC112277384 isoform X2 [Physcomitrella patens]